jgi:protein CpxP
MSNIESTSDWQEDEMFSTKFRKVIGVGAALGLVAAITAGALAAQGPGPRRGGRGFGGPGGPGFGIGPGFGPGGPRGGGDLLRGLRDLNITDQQREQIRTITEQHRAEFQQLGERGRTAHEALRQALDAETVDEGAIRERHAAVAAVEADTAVLGARVRAEVFQVLTPEQQQKTRDLKAARQKQMEERRQQMEQRRQQRQQNQQNQPQNPV